MVTERDWERIEEIVKPFAERRKQWFELPFVIALIGALIGAGASLGGVAINDHFAANRAVVEREKAYGREQQAEFDSLVTTGLKLANDADGLAKAFWYLVDKNNQRVGTAVAHSGAATLDELSSRAAVFRDMYAEWKTQVEVVMARMPNDPRTKCLEDAQSALHEVNILLAEMLVFREQLVQRVWRNLDKDARAPYLVRRQTGQSQDPNDLISVISKFYRRKPNGAQPIEFPDENGASYIENARKELQEAAGLLRPSETDEKADT
ncbi:MAG: hypothetical protein NCW75_13820 [Phycisphaera sp.]|nr:MAG: hypothetical protein NCW75_13820 [Phycisphaera sp.]